MKIYLKLLLIASAAFILLRYLSACNDKNDLNIPVIYRLEYNFQVVGTLASPAVLVYSDSAGVLQTVNTSGNWSKSFQTEDSYEAFLSASGRHSGGSVSIQATVFKDQSIEFRDQKSANGNNPYDFNFKVESNN